MKGEKTAVVWILGYRLSFRSPFFSEKHTGSIFQLFSKDILNISFMFLVLGLYSCSISKILKIELMTNIFSSSCNHVIKVLEKRKWNKQKERNTNGNNAKRLLHFLCYVGRKGNNKQIKWSKTSILSAQHSEDCIKNQNSVNLRRHHITRENINTLTWNDPMHALAEY